MFKTKLYIRLFLSLGLLSPLAASADAPPTIRANLSQNDQVSILIKSTSKRAPSRTQLVVSRSLNHGAFTTLTKINVTKRTTVAEMLDALGSNVTVVVYRTRLIGNNRSRWSNRAVVNVDSSNDNSEDPTLPQTPSTPTPTPVPEPQSPKTPEESLPDGFSSCSRSAVVEVLELVNAARLTAGSGSITENSHLATSSLKFSLNMAKTKTFAHDGWYENIVANGFKGSAFGQNIGYGSVLSQKSMMTAWMNSEGHRQNILSKNFSQIGVGCVLDRAGGAWWTQDFGG